MDSLQGDQPKEGRGRPKRESLPWRERENLDLRLAREVSGVSEASLYKAAHDNKLTFVKLEGRTLVKTSSLIRFMKEREKGWTPDIKRGAAGRAKRVEAARAN